MKVLLKISLLSIFMLGCSSGDSSAPEKGPFEGNLKLKNEVCNFMPENDIKIPISAKAINGVTEQVFNEVLNEIETVYAPIVAQNGARLVVQRLWQNNDFNAKAYRQGNNFVIEMYGGLARHPDVTRDAFLLVACHEVGHHLGGAPKYNGTDWASNEGQSDYFATMKCARKVFRRYPRTPQNIDIEAENRCKEHHSAQEKEICIRSAMGGLSLAKAMSRQSGGREPRLDLKDSRVVSSTQDSHPQPQCRLDTYFQGGLCETSDNTNFDDRNPNVGACTYAQSEDYGARPQCWFRPSGGGGPNPTPTPTPPPGPGDGIANQPTLNGRTEFRTSNPRQPITIQWNVSNFQGARGVFIEFSKPDQEFDEQNDTTGDPNGLGGASIAQVIGSVTIIPERQLPGWGAYQIRIIPLDSTGRRPVGRFSNSSVLTLRP